MNDEEELEGGEDASGQPADKEGRAEGPGDDRYESPRACNTSCPVRCRSAGGQKGTGGGHGGVAGVRGRLHLPLTLYPLPLLHVT